MENILVLVVITVLLIERYYQKNHIKNYDEVVRDYKKEFILVKEKHKKYEEELELEKQKFINSCKDEHIGLVRMNDKLEKQNEALVKENRVLRETLQNKAFSLLVKEAERAEKL